MSQHIIQQLCAFKAPNVFNPWTDSDRLDADPSLAAAARVLRLQDHFNVQPSHLLIGEAPGYQGCHFSGVAFTNEKLVLDGAIPRVRWFNRISKRTRPWCEPSATIVWRALHRLGIAGATVMWNCFAWHPHQPGELHSNRAPTNAEIEAGVHVLRLLLEYFDGAQVVAVGRLAEHTLTKLGIPSNAVRHPSMGGATEFAAGLERLCRRAA